MLFDTHTHADYSCDAEQTIGEAAEAAHNLGLGIILTEHWDRYYPSYPESFLFDIADYFKHNTPLRSATVLLGIEVGLQPKAIPEDKAMVKQYPFDEVVGSMHCFDGLDMYEPDTYKGLSKDEAVRRYLEDSVRCLEMEPDFDSYGHIDYICRYMPHEDPNLYYSDHPELWDRVFQLLIDQDKAIEINTRRLGNPAVVPPLVELYKRFHELGGTYATLGSDAHYKEHVGRDFAVGKQIADAAGLQLVYFKERKRMVCGE